MEELIPIIIIFVVSSIISSAKKSQKAAEAQRRHAAATTARMQSAPQQVRATAAPKPVQPPAAAAVPMAVAQPKVHTHYQPDCETHDVPGSLGVTSTEGTDPCHEEQLIHQRPIEAEASPEAGLTFDWTGDNMVKAIVMQEILTRPADRLAPVQRRTR